MAESCVVSCPTVAQAMRETEFGLTIGLHIRICAVFPPAWTFSVLGAQRTVSVMNRVERAVTPTTPELKPINPNAAHDLVRSFVNLPSCPGPAESTTQQLLTFSRTRRLFGQPTTETVQSYTCASVTAAPSQRQSCIERCPTVTGLVTVVTTALVDASNEKGLVESIKNLVVGRVDSIALKKAHELAGELGETAKNAAGDVGRLAARAEFFANASKTMFRALKYLNLAKNSLELIAYFPVLKSYDQLVSHLRQCYQCPPDADSCVVQ